MDAANERPVAISNESASNIKKTYKEQYLILAILKITPQKYGSVLPGEFITNPNGLDLG